MKLKYNFLGINLSIAIPFSSSKPLKKNKFCSAKRRILPAYTTGNNSDNIAKLIQHSLGWHFRNFQPMKYEHLYDGAFAPDYSAKKMKDERFLIIITIHYISHNSSIL